MTSYGPSCPQQALNFVPPEGLDPQALQYLLALSGTGQSPESEDCTLPLSFYFSGPDPTIGLTLNVIKPTDTGPKTKLPVVVVRYL